jgi:AhpD family alkylhydroperoxidase
MKRITNLLLSLNPLGKAAAKKPVSPFGGYKKRTMTAKELVLGAASLVPDAGTVYRVWVKHEIDAGFREELMLAVSKLNDCRYCSWGHHEWAHIVGIPEEELAHIEQMDPSNFDRKKWLAISFVRELVTARFGRVSKVLMSEMKANYSAREIKEIILVAKVMDIGNRGANTWDAMLSRLQGKPAAESRVVDEAVLSAVFLTAAPLVLLYLSRASKRPLAELARSLIDYTKHVEAREAKGQGVR